MKYVRLLLLMGTVGIIVLLTVLVAPVFSQKTKILTVDEMSLAHGGCGYWSCPCGACVDSACYVPETGDDGYHMKVGNNSEYANCKPGEGVEYDYCTPVEPAPCWISKFGCIDPGCVHGCDWSEQPMASMCEMGDY